MWVGSRWCWVWVERESVLSYIYFFSSRYSFIPLFSMDRLIESLDLICDRLIAISEPCLFSEPIHVVTVFGADGVLSEILVQRIYLALCREDGFRVSDLRLSLE